VAIPAKIIANRRLRAVAAPLGCASRFAVITSLPVLI